ncbi:hypothetical protein EBU99_06055 [bacterium]|nr:hypothetical protein [bacterium]
MSKEVLDQHHQTAGHVGIEPDNLPVKSIAWAMVALVVIVAACFIVGRQLYWYASSNAVQEAELNVPNKLLSELNAADKDQLTNYDVVDQQKGVYRLPIDEGIKLYVKKNGD